ncbi:MAG: hypothetical protein AAF526_10010, partial [Pseudomonadota bacterium]
AAWDIYRAAYDRAHPFLIAGRHGTYHFHWGASEATLKQLIDRFPTAKRATNPIPVDIVFEDPDGNEGWIIATFKRMNETPGGLGAILDSGKWSMLANDAWILGGVNSGKLFHIVSPLSWLNLWTPPNDGGKGLWRKWFMKRGAGKTFAKPSRMTITAREMIGVRDMAGYEIVRHGTHLILAERKEGADGEPVPTSFHSLGDYTRVIANYAGAQDPQGTLYERLFKTLPRNTTFHASPHLIVDETLTTVEDFLRTHPGHPDLHAALKMFDPQGDLLLQEDPAQPYSPEDLDRGLAKVFARKPNVAYVIDLRGANLAGADPYKFASHPKAHGEYCYLICTLTDFTAAKFGEAHREKLNILFAEGIYNGARFTNADMGGLTGQIWDSTYDDTTLWGENFDPASEELSEGYHPDAAAFCIYDDD